MNDSSTETSSTPVTKRPYEKPTFRYEKMFVTSALSCGKIAGTGGGCAMTGGKVS